MIFKTNTILPARATLTVAIIGVLCLVNIAISRSASSKTLSRTEDPVVATANAVSSMAGAEIEKLALLAWTNDSFAPIPFQVDERAADGKFVYSEGPKADPSQGNKKYDKEDELVFMAMDTGDKAPEGSALPCSPSRSAELEIKDTLGGGKAWAYLVECSEGPPRSNKDYVKNEYDGTRDWVKTERYHFAEKRGEAYFDRLALMGPNGKVGPNHCDRIKGRMKISLTGGLINLDMAESDIKGSILAWIDGPVRVIHRMGAHVQFSVIKLKVGGGSENLFYHNYLVTPIQIDMPFAPSSILSSFETRYTIDWKKGFNGTKYYDPINTKGVVLDGKMSAAEKAMDYDTPHDWYALAGPHGNLVVKADIPDNMRKSVSLKLFYIDDETLEDPPESEVGQRCPGVVFDLINIKAGTYKYSIYYMVPEQAPPASVPAMLNILDHPLQVRSRAFQ